MSAPFDVDEMFEGLLALDPDRAKQRSAEKTARVAQETFEGQSVQDLMEGVQSAAQGGNVSDMLQAQQRVRALQMAVRGATGAAVGAEQAGLPEQKEETIRGLRQYFSADRPEPSTLRKLGGRAWDIAGGAGRAALKVLDFPHEQTTRRFTQGSLDPNRSAADLGVMSFEDWNQAIEHGASASPVRAALKYGPRLSPLTYFGAAGGTAWDLAGQGVNALAGGEASPPLSQTWDTNVEQQANLFRGLLDPSLLLSSAKGGAKVIADDVVRMGKRHGKDLGALADKLAKAWTMADHTAHTSAGTKRIFENSARALKKAGVPDSEIARVWGKDGGLMGSQQMQVAGKEIAPMLGVEKPLAKAEQALFGQGGVGGRFSPMKQVGRTKERMVRAEERQLRRAFDQETREVIAPTIVGKNIDPAARKGLVEQFFDPKFSEQQFEVAMSGKPQPGVQAFTPASPLPITGAPEQLALGEGMEGIFQRRGELLEATGTVPRGGLTFNPASGRYIPRQTEIVGDTAGGMAGEIFHGRPGGGQASFQHARKEGGGAPLAGVFDAERTIPRNVLDQVKVEGRFALKAEKDPLRILPKYNRDTATAIAKTEALEWLSRSPLVKTADKLPNITKTPGWVQVAQGRAVPEDFYRLVMEGFEGKHVGYAQAIERMTRVRVPGPVRAALQVADRMHSTWKGTVLVTRPAYHVINTLNDIQWLMAIGDYRLAPWRAAADLKRAHRAVRGDSVPGTVAGMSWDNVVRLAEENAVVQHAGAERAHMINRGVEQQTELLMRGGRGTRNPYKKALEKAEGFADTWNDTSKLAAFARRLELGDAPAQAAERTLEGMIDYTKGMTSPLDQVGRQLFSFYTFMRRAPAAAVRNYISNPGVAVQYNRLWSSMSDTSPEAQALRPPTSVQERGTSFPLRPEGGGANLYAASRRAFGGRPMPESDRTFINSRDVSVEPFSAISQIDPLAGAMNPYASALTEQIFHKDLRTKQNLPETTPGLFNFNTPGYVKAAAGGMVGGAVGSRFGLPGAGAGALLGGAAASLAPEDWTESDPTQKSAMSYFGAMLPGGLGAPPLQLGYNTAVRRLEGPDAPLQIIGSQREYAPDPGSLEAHQALGLLAFPGYQVGPLQRVSNWQRSPGFDQLIDLNRLQKKKQTNRLFQGLLP